MRVLLALLALAAPAAEAAEDVVLGLSQDQVAITATFDGSKILIFGAVKREQPIPDGPPLEMVVTLSGPAHPVTVRRMSRQFGIWMNTDSVLLDSAPTFYAVATSAPFDRAMNDGADLTHRVSIDRAVQWIGANMLDSNAEEFADAVIRIRERAGLYRTLENSVIIDEQTLFRTEIEMPANVTEGSYQTRIFLTRGGEVVGDYDTVIDVRKVGLERWLYNTSRENPLFYGLMSLFIAITAGWAASALFRFARG